MYKPVENHMYAAMMVALNDSGIFLNELSTFVYILAYLRTSARRQVSIYLCHRFKTTQIQIPWNIHMEIPVPDLLRNLSGKYATEET